LKRFWRTEYWRSIGVNRAVFALSVARMADAMGNSILFIVLPLLVVRIPEGYVPLPVEVQVGILISLYGLINSALQPVMGALSDRLGRRKPLIVAGLALMAAGTLGFVAATTFLDLVVLRAVQGLGIALTVPASMAIMATVTEKRTRGGAMGFYTTLRIVGFTIGPLLGGFLQVHAGFDAAFYAGTALLLVALAIVQLWVRDVRVVAARSGQRRTFRIIDSSLLKPGILGAALATFVMASAFSMVTTLENEFNARLGMTAIGFSIAFSALMIGRLASQVPLGRLSDHIGRKPLIVAGLLATAPVTALLGVVSSMDQLVVLRLGQGIAAAAIAAPAFAVAGDLSTAGGEGRQMSVLTTGFGLGIALGPLIAGLLAVVFFELPFLVLGALNLFGAWIVYRYLPETVRS
jgi:MFS family permease